ncbi:MAG: hypothetical protein EOL88_00640 [Bacteroidia bacterium]|nr:hypothetical protein [Bacteroidia bacterium]
MNTKEAKKIRKGTRNSFIIFLRKKPNFMPKFVWRWCAKKIFNKDGLKLIGALYGMKGTLNINGVKYKIKN